MSLVAFSVVRQALAFLESIQVQALREAPRFLDPEFFTPSPPNLLTLFSLSHVASVNVLVQNCKIYNDASCDISADGQLLAAFIPSSQRGFPDEGILAVYSLAPHNLGEMLYTKRFGKGQEAQSSDRDASTWAWAFLGEAQLTGHILPLLHWGPGQKKIALSWLVALQKNAMNVLRGRAFPTVPLLCWTRMKEELCS